MKPETIKIDEVEYVRKDSVITAQPGSNDIRIAVLQRGWVVVGRFSQDGDMCKLSNANVIRVWGTTKGLGEIAIGGPTTKTILDKSPDIEFHILTSVMLINCVRSAWENKLT